MNPHPTPIERLRARYHDHLASPLPGAVRGHVAGKQTRRGMRQGREWAGQTADAWLALDRAWLEHPSRVWTWSDLHVGHDNVIGYCDRPFGNANQMDFEMARNAQVVGEDDWVLISGDVAMWRELDAVAAWVRGCPGRKALVLGNHDVRGRGVPTDMEQWRTAGFEAVADVAVLSGAHGVPELWVTHYPLLDGDIPAHAVNLHGHTHDKILAWPHVSACVEVIDYRPVSLLERVRNCRP